MIITEGLCKQFDGFVAVDEVSLEVKAGEVLALLGPNGAGKTTTVRMLTSVLRPTRGWARVAGYDVVSQAAQVRSSVGILTEQHGLYGRMPADDYLDFFGQLYGMDKQDRQERITQLLSDFGLLGDVHRKIGEYSKGMRQKLALARALLHDPPVLLLDEPTSAMDPESARLVRDAIHSLRSARRAILLCTHNLAEAEELADQIAIIRHGKIIARGSPQCLKERFLGAPVYELRLARPYGWQVPILPDSAKVLSQGADYFNYQTAQPEVDNPLILQRLVEQGAAVFGMRELPRSLEKAYLQAVNGSNGKEAQDARDAG